MSVHDLTAAYALDALDEVDEAAYEEHLRHCERCREELAVLGETATSLAYAVDAPPPPPALRERILESARAERPNVVPLRPRWVTIAAGSVAAAAAAAAITLGLWASSLSRSLEAEREAIAVLADPTAREIPIGGEGRLVVNRSGEAALVVRGVERAPSGKTYEVWVIERGRPQPAGLFDSAGGGDVVRLTRTVPRGATVAVTLEESGGVDAPTGRPLMSAQA